MIAIITPDLDYLVPYVAEIEVTITKDDFFRDLNKYIK